MNRGFGLVRYRYGTVLDCSTYLCRSVAILRVTCLATGRRAPIQPDRLSLRLDLFLVTLRAAYFVVGAIERERRLAVIERTGAPLGDAVAGGAILFLSGAHELAAMHVLMTLEALARGTRKVKSGFRRAGGGCLGPVTIRARNALVRGFERKLSSRVIEGSQFFPLPQVVASLARDGRSMRIGVAGNAGLILEVILARRDRGCPRQRLVAIHAQYRCMGRRESEFRGRVAGWTERGGPERILGVACLALVPVRCCRELAGVRIGMTIDADQLMDRVMCVLASRRVALLAFERSVLAFQTERTLLMRLLGEQRRFEAYFVMARGTVRPGGSSFELTLMDVLVAIPAQCMRHWLAEVIGFVTPRARDFSVLAIEGKRRGLMVEGGVARYGSPSGSVMAGLAGAGKLCILKGAMMWIVVTVLAARKRKTLVTWCNLTRPGRVAFPARHVPMQAG